MLLRFNVPFDNGKVRIAAGETTDAFDGSYALRLVRSGLAEAMDGPDALDHARGKAGMAALAIEIEQADDVTIGRASMAMTRTELLDLADELGVEVESDDNKTELVRKINEAS